MTKPQEHFDLEVNRKQINQHLVDQSASIREALAKLDLVKIKICVVVDADGHLIQTVTDGDVRRGLLSGVNLSDAVVALPHRDPVSIPQDAGRALWEEIARKHPYVNIVVVDDQHRPVGLAGNAGAPKVILLSPPHLGIAEAEYVRQAFEENWIAPAGPNVDAFENELSRIVGREYAVALSSGTAGLHLALRALNLAEGKSVYVSDLTFAASLQPILYERRRPVLIDAEPGTWNMSPQALQRRLEKDKRTGALPGAIVVVHLYGQPADMDRIVQIADQFGVPIIEDAAESLGAQSGNSASGTQGLIGVYSFNGNKIVTTSGGGALVTGDIGIANRVRKLATQGRDRAEHYQHSEIAYNYRMSNVLAGIGLGQLEVLEERVARRREIFERYFKRLDPFPGVTFQKDAANAMGNRWLTVVDLDPNLLDIHPYQIMRQLRERGIETRPAWKPMHMQPLCEGMAFEPHSQTGVTSSSHFLRSLCLPSGSSLTLEEQDRVIAAFEEIYLKACK